MFAPPKLTTAFFAPTVRGTENMPYRGTVPAVVLTAAALPVASTRQMLWLHDGPVGGTAISPTVEPEASSACTSSTRARSFVYEKAFSESSCTVVVLPSLSRTLTEAVSLRATPTTSCPPPATGAVQTTNACPAARSLSDASDEASSSTLARMVPLTLRR